MKSISIQRYSCILYCIITLLLSSPLYAQQYDQAIVSISASPIDITTLAKTIAKQTGLEYSLNMQNASLKKRIILRSGNWQLANILKQVQKQANLSYKIIGDHILFMDARSGSGKRNAPTEETSGTPHDTKTRFRRTARRTESIADSNRTLTLEVLPAIAYTDSDTALMLHSLTQIPQGPHFRKRGANYRMPAAKKTNRTTPLTPPSDSTTSTANTASTKESSTPKPVALISSNNNNNKTTVNWYKPYLKAGLSADEILYGNVSLITGFRYLYGIASYGYTSYGGRFRWGAGIPVQLNETQQLHISFTTGTIKYHVPDTLGITDIRLKERLNRYSLGWSKTFAEKWTLHVQVHYNDLRKKADYIPPPIFQDFGDQRKFRYGKAPYTISERFGTKNDYQRWIGAQLSLYYQFY